MRDIKFRAWDKKNKCWYKTELTFYGFSLFGECTLICPPRVEDLQNLETSQFTGLHDKNGKEIYEGDIVKYGYDDFEEDKTIHQVKYMGDEDYPAFDLVPNLGVESNGLSHAMAVGHIEVIGNIYENPELLEAKP